MFNSFFREIYDFRTDGFHTLNICNQPVQFVKFYIKGRSFGYNMIRKMLGSISEVLMFDLPVDTLKQCFDPKIKKHIAKVPSEGLILWRASYEDYNNRILMKAKEHENKPYIRLSE